jgi:hypothetical protein
LPIVRLASILLPACLVLALAPPAAHAEAEPVLPAAELVMPALLTGPGYRVEPQVQIQGYQARFVLHTDWGSLEAESAEMLAIRISEIPAMDALFTAEISGLIAESAQSAAMAPVRAVGQVVMNPVDSMIGLPVGAVRFFGERITKWGRRAKRLGDRIDDRISHEGDPYRDPEGPMGATRVEVEGAQRSWWDKPQREMGRLVRGELRYRRARVELAEKLGIDPYTSNPILNDRLDRLAWMTSTGNFATRQLVSVATVGFAETLGYAQDLERLVLRESPESLRDRNHERLTHYCSDEDLLERFLRHRAFSPTLQTAFTEEVVALRLAHGCEALLETALMAGSEVEARFVLNALRLVHHYAGDAAVGGRVLAHGATLAYRTRSGEFLLPVPVDLLSWTPQMEQWFDRALVNGHRNPTLLVSGRISDLAQRRLTERNWNLVAHVPYPGAPPYPVSPAAPRGLAPR